MKTQISQLIRMTKGKQKKVRPLDQSLLQKGIRHASNFPGTVKITLETGH